VPAGVGLALGVIGPCPGPAQSASPAVGDITAGDTAAALPAEQDTTTAAIAWMREAVTVHLDGRHHLLLRALRQKRDPALRPWFEALAEPGQHPALRVHALLGLAETASPPGLTLDRIRQAESLAVRAELIVAGLDGGLIDDATRRDLLNRSDLAPWVRVKLAAPLVATPRTEAVLHLRAGLEQVGHHGPEAAAAGAALLLNELGEPIGRAGLERWLEDPRATAEAILLELLQMAWEHGLDRSAGWADRLSAQPHVSRRVRHEALKTAIRFGAESADRRWAELYAAAPDDAERRELAWLGLEVAPWLDAAALAAMGEDPDPVIGLLGEVAASIARSRADPAEHLDMVRRAGELLATQQPRAWRWAAQHAERTGSVQMVAEMLDRYEPEPVRGRARRLKAVALATQTMIDARPEVASGFLLGQLRAPEADPDILRAILLGLIRSRSAAVTERIVPRLEPFDEPATEALRLVLKLSTEAPLDADEADRLAWMITDADDLDGSLRVQAAWAYLKRTGQSASALATLLPPIDQSARTPPDVPPP
jgi:hypothetical protein